MHVSSSPGIHRPLPRTRAWSSAPLSFWGFWLLRVDQLPVFLVLQSTNHTGVFSASGRDQTNQINPHLIVSWFNFMENPDSSTNPVDLILIFFQRKQTFLGFLDHFTFSHSSYYCYNYASIAMTTPLMYTCNCMFPYHWKTSSQLSESNICWMNEWMRI